MAPGKFSFLLAGNPAVSNPGSINRMTAHFERSLLDCATGGENLRPKSVFSALYVAQQRQKRHNQRFVPMR
jgi:hypothetical protein